VFQAVMSRKSGCAITDSISAASATVRVIGPWCASTLSADGG